jgi:DNA-binding response OmpR family regulator
MHIYPPTKARRTEERTLRLIVVEDDPLVGPAARAVLERHGFDVAGVATTTDKALRLAARARPDLALVDLRLGRGGDGLSTAHVMKAVYGIPSLLMTGFDVKGAEIGGAAMGVLRKPFSPEALVRAVTAAGAVLNGETPSEVPRSLELLHDGRAVPEPWWGGGRGGGRD